MERRDAAGAVVVRGDGRVLLVRRGRAPGRGSLSLPGGKVEPGETPAEAVVREVREETGLDVGVIELLTVVPFEGEGFSYAIHEFLCAITMKEGGDSATPGDDAAEVTWALPSELETLGVSSGVRSVVARGVGRLREIAC